MSTALNEFRAQREAVDDVRVRLEEVGKLIAALTSQADALTRDPALRQLMQTEQTWLAQTERALQTVRAFRENEMQRFWLATWRRWAIALAFALASAAAFGAGWFWAARPYELELASLRQRVELLDFVALLFGLELRLFSSRKIKTDSQQSHRLPFFIQGRGQVAYDKDVRIVRNGELRSYFDASAAIRFCNRTCR